MPAGIAPKTSPKKATKPKPDESLTEAELERREKFREYGRKGGLARKSLSASNELDEAQAHELVKKDWAEVGSKLVKQVLKAARDPQKSGQSLVSLTTAAGIAYDKRWSKATADTTEIAMPPALISAIAAKCASHSPNPLTTHESGNMVQGKPFTEQEQEQGSCQAGAIHEPASEPASQDG